MTHRVRGVANIGPGERRKRLLFGVVVSAGGALVIALDLPARSSSWLVAVLTLFFLGALGVLQARAHT
jgi:hypothetical protein